MIDMEEILRDIQTHRPCGTHSSACSPRYSCGIRATGSTSCPSCRYLPWVYSDLISPELSGIR